LSRKYFLLCHDMSSSPDEVGNNVATILLKIKAVQINVKKPFRWSSGWYSPIYCDNRLSLSYPEERTYIRDALTSLIKLEYPDVQVIAGVATAGIPQGALVADKLNLPFIYVRSKPKGHGMENLIEGKIEAGSKVVVIEDLISTGRSSLEAIAALRKSGAEVLGLTAIFTYGFPIAEESFEKSDVPYFTLSNYRQLLMQAINEGYVNKNDLEKLTNWQSNPARWGL